MLTLRYLVMIGWLATSFAVILLVLFAIPTLLQARKTLRSLEKTLHQASGSLEETTLFFSYLNRRLGALGSILDLLNPLQGATREAQTYLRQFARSPRIEIASLIAGIKKGIALIRKKMNPEKGGKTHVS